MARDGATLPLTAEGLLCRQYLGWPHDDPRLNAGVDYLVANLPAWDRRNVYYWYYATQVLHHMEGKPWRAWNDEMKVLLPTHQEKRGRERGSWDPKGDRWGDAGGRLEDRGKLAACARCHAEGNADWVFGLPQDAQ